MDLLIDWNWSKANRGRNGGQYPPWGAEQLDSWLCFFPGVGEDQGEIG